MPAVHYLALSRIPGLTNAQIDTLIRTLGSADAVFSANADALGKVVGIEPAAVAAIRDANLTSTYNELRELKQRIHVYTPDDVMYPGNLNMAFHPPPVLYTRGRLALTDTSAVTITGLGEIDDRKRAFVRYLAGGLSDRGLSVVSGFAPGTDTAVHDAVVAAGGRTLAVLGSGIDRIHPAENERLANEIEWQGAVISPYPPDTAASPRHLSQRTQLMAGLSRAVIIIAAEKDSRALDTARYARQHRRLLLALPGSPLTDAMIKSGERALSDNPDLDDLAEQIRSYQIPLD